MSAFRWSRRWPRRRSAWSGVSGSAKWRVLTPRGQPVDGVPKEQQVEQSPNQEVSSNGRQGNDEEPQLIPPYEYIVPKKTRHQESLALTRCIYWEMGLVMYTCKTADSGLQKWVGSKYNMPSTRILQWLIKSYIYTFKLLITVRCQKHPEGVPFLAPSLNDHNCFRCTRLNMQNLKVNWRTMKK